MFYVFGYIFMGLFSAALAWEDYKENPAEGWILILFWPILIPWCLGTLVRKLIK